ncbi:MAG: M66 family metalloprotease [Polyangiaceae bacterium]
MRWAVWFGVAGLAGIMGACGASGDGGADAVPLGNPGCTGAGDCSLCGVCFDKCVCENGDGNACAVACGVDPGSGGSGAQGGSGGSGAAGGSDQGGSAGTGASGGAAGNAGTTSGGNGGTSATGDQATGIRISSISVWQSVKVPVMENGGSVSASTRKAPVVASKDAVFRVYVSPDADWQPRQLAAVLDLNGQSYEATLSPNIESTDGEINSTFNIKVPGSAITTGSSYSVTLFETGGGGPGSNAGSRYPGSGSENLGAEDPRGPLHIVLVPITINGNTPDVGQNRVDSYIKRLTSMYPIPTVEMSVRQAVNYGSNVSANGSGWSNLLNSIYNLRQQDNAPKNTYYYGVLAPTTSAQSYCSGGCVAGLSGLPASNDDYQRGSIGLGVFPDGQDIGSADTMAHELGHAHGRPHTMCGTGESGSGYPYSGGGIGSWGYDLSIDRVRQPTTYKDVMGYCSPNWISDYNYNKIFDRVAYVNGGGYVVPPSDPARLAGDYMSFIVEADGRVIRVADVHLNGPAWGEESSATLVDQDGNEIQDLKGFYYPFAEEQFGGTLLVPKPKQLPALAYGIASKLSPAGVVAPLGVIHDNRLH